MTYANEARKTPEKKETEAERKEQKARLIESDKQAIRRTFATADGRKALKAIMDKCCYQKKIVVHSTNGYDSEATINNVALREHYIWLRKNIDQETLIAVEITGIQEPLTE